MSHIDNDRSDIKQAAEQADSQKIAKNLEGEQKSATPETLSKDEQTSFIKEELRTDK